MTDEGCDVAPITDWGVTEPPNTEALLTTVRNELILPKLHGRADEAALAALDAIASEIERLNMQIAQGEKIIKKRGEEIDRQMRRAEATEQDIDLPEDYWETAQ